jgi:EAL domain-containing protein (putative c-di-GMP-specific phosphodiesterase class I)
MIELELSETQAMLFVPGDTVHVQALRQLGVRIAIDDFGTSFNSLARLNALSISSFKINPQCVQDLEHSADARAISSCMLAIGKAMGIEVIAQGVETQEQAEVLLQQGCEVIQGFYAGHPMTADTLLHMLKLN